jgi:hypothetical protein
VRASSCDREWGTLTLNFGISNGFPAADARQAVQESNRLPSRLLQVSIRF